MDLMSWLVGVGGLVVGAVGAVYGFQGYRVGRDALREQREAIYSVVSFDVENVRVAPPSTTGLRVFKGKEQVMDPVLSTVTLKLLSGPDIVIPAKMSVFTLPSNFINPEAILEASIGEEEAVYTQESGQYLRSMPDGSKESDVYDKDYGIALPTERMIRVGEVLEFSVITEGSCTIQRVLELPNVRWREHATATDQVGVNS